MDVIVRHEVIEWLLLRRRGIRMEIAVERIVGMSSDAEHLCRIMGRAATEVGQAGG
jgi:hypothetical protein